jgi:hypothetical protein
LASKHIIFKYDRMIFSVKNEAVEGGGEKKARGV